MRGWRLPLQIITALIRYWPVGNSLKSIMFLNEMEDLFDNVALENFDVVAEPVAKHLTRCVAADQFQVAERALYLWNTESFCAFMLFSKPVVARVLPIIFPVLFCTADSHWHECVAPTPWAKPLLAYRHPQCSAAPLLTAPGRCHGLLCGSRGVATLAANVMSLYCDAVRRVLAEHPRHVALANRAGVSTPLSPGCVLAAARSQHADLCKVQMEVLGKELGAEAAERVAKLIADAAADREYQEAYDGSMGSGEFADQDGMMVQMGPEGGGQSAGPQGGQGGQQNHK